MGWQQSLREKDKGEAGTGLPSTACPALLWRPVVAGVVEVEEVVVILPSILLRRAPRYDMYMCTCSHSDGQRNHTGKPPLYIFV